MNESAINPQPAPPPATVQVVFLQLGDGRRCAYSGPVQIDQTALDAVKVVGVEVTGPLPLPPGYVVERLEWGPCACPPPGGDPCPS